MACRSLESIETYAPPFLKISLNLVIGGLIDLRTFEQLNNQLTVLLFSHLLIGLDD